MRRQPATIICDAARSRAPQPASSQAGDWHDVSGHHRYYGSSAINGGEHPEYELGAHEIPAILGRIF